MSSYIQIIVQIIILDAEQTKEEANNLRSENMHLKEKVKELEELCKNAGDE